MKEIKVNIDGNDYNAKAGSTILEIARENDIYIPTLCFDPRMAPYGACRLCLVEVEGARGLLPSCTTEATDGMIIKTSTENLEKIRKTLVELLISDHPKGCAGCSSSGNCELQKLADKYGIEQSSFEGEEHEYPILRDNPFILRDYNKCVLCGRCIRICREVQGVGVYDFVNRGFKAVPGTPYENPMPETPCEFCGQCISTCPTGALTSRPTEEGDRSWKRDLLRASCAVFNCDTDTMMDTLGLSDWKVRTTCSYCGCGCQLDLHVVDDKIVEVTSPVMEGPGEGNLCVKGRFGYEFIHSEHRLTKPLIKRNGEFEEATWDEAVDLIAKKFEEIKDKSGPDSFSVLASARITNEENYLIQKFTRAVIGTNNIDHCARL